MADQDMWGDFRLEAVRTPVQVLKEQAAALGPKTKYLVVARVSTSTRHGDFYHELVLVVPALDDYQYDLLQLTHRIDLYPLELEHYSDKSLNQTVNSELELNIALQRALSSEKTKRIIASLIGQASAMAS